MFSLVLSVVVMSANGGLLAERIPAAGMLVGAVNIVDSHSYDNMTVTELTAERGRLADTMPSVGLGIALTAIGGGVLLTGLIIATVSFYLEVVLVGLLVMAASIPLLIIGPIMIARAARERRDVQTQMRLIDQRLASLNRDGGEQQFTPIVPQDNNEVPPPPPMRPPGSEFAPSVPADFLVASF